MESTEEHNPNLTNIQQHTWNDHQSSHHKPQEGFMKATFIEEYKKPYIIKEVPIPKPGHGEVLIKVEAAPINPSDLEVLKGSVTDAKSLPLPAGIEGSGTVISSGGGLYARSLVKKRVAFAIEPKDSGTWAEYAICRADLCVPIDHSISFEEGACGVINPFAAIALSFEINAGHHKAVVLNAACSQLGRMLVKILQKEHVKTIAIVRREEQGKILEELGADVVLNSQESGFEEELGRKALELNANCLLEPVCGELTFKLLKALPTRSTCIIYGHLSSEELTKLDLTDLLVHNKTIRSFNLTTWLSQQGVIKKLRVFRKVTSLLATELKSHIAKTFKIDEINEALEYYRKHMTDGKVLVKPY